MIEAMLRTALPSVDVAGYVDACVSAGMTDDPAALMRVDESELRQLGIVAVKRSHRRLVYLTLQLSSCCKVREHSFGQGVVRASREGGGAEPTAKVAEQHKEREWSKRANQTQTRKWCHVLSGIPLSAR